MKKNLSEWKKKIKEKKSRFFPKVRKFLVSFKGKKRWNLLGFFFSFFLALNIEAMNWGKFFPKAIILVVLSSVVLGSFFFFRIAVKEKYEELLGALAILLGLFCWYPVSFSFLMGYALFWVAPCFVINFYQNQKKTVAGPSFCIFQIFSVFFNLTTFVVASFWMEWHSKFFLLNIVLDGLPGILALFSSSILLWGMMWREKRVLTAPPVRLFDYWWLVICQLGCLFFFERDLVFFNQFISGLLPFSFKVLPQMREKFEKKIGEKPAFFLGLACIFLMVPLFCWILWVLVEPWFTGDKDDGEN